jgi:rare lipoprotein A (peptidoglycan hydrolase)
MILALPWKPDGKMYRVMMRSGQGTRSIVVRHADRGPGRKSRSRGTICDLSVGAMRALAGPEGIRAGRVWVRVRAIRR